MQLRHIGIEKSLSVVKIEMVQTLKSGLHQ